jgi:hypothetical protein
VEHFVGYLIIGLGLTLTTAAVVWRYIQWKNKIPKYFHRGVGVRFQNNVVVPWPHLEDAIDSIDEAMKQHPELANKVVNHLDFWIEVVPYHEEVITPSITSGYLNLEGTRSVPKPKTAEAAKTVTKVTGSLKHERFLPITKQKTIIVVRQLRQGPREDDALALSTGTTKPAGSSALFHEYAQHVVPTWIFGDSNAQHKRTDMKAFEEDIKKSYNRRRTA